MEHQQILQMMAYMYCAYVTFAISIHLLDTINGTEITTKGFQFCLDVMSSKKQVLTGLLTTMICVVGGFYIVAMFSILHFLYFFIVVPCTLKYYR